MKKGKITVIISTFNRKDYIGKAIDSVLNQNYEDYEIVVIDDCSSDGTGEYIKEKYSDENIQYIRNEKNLGCGLSRKKALSTFSDGEFIIFLDDDDCFTNDRYFEEAVEMMNKNKSISIVAAPHVVNDVTTGTKTPKKFPYKKVVNRKELFLHFASEEYPKPIISVAMIRRSSFDKANWQDMKILNDSTIYLRAITEGDMGFVKDYSAEYLVHGNNISFNMKTDFIIDNLDEKYKVYKIVEGKNTYTKDELDKWLEEQLDVTIIYFIRGSKPNFWNFRKIIMWYKKNINNKKKIEEFKQIYKESKKSNKTI